MSEAKQYYYTCHHNWEWVVTAAIQYISNSESSSSLSQVTRFKDLPSSSGGGKPSYSLFRIDEVCGTNTLQVIRSVYASGTTFAFLDPKDSLYLCFERLSLHEYMPKTTFISWNCVSAEDIGEFPSHPSLLKAALGSGGFG